MITIRNRTGIGCLGWLKDLFCCKPVRRPLKPPSVLGLTLLLPSCRAASLVAASKDEYDSEPHYFINEPRENPERAYHFTRPTRPVFSAVPFLSLHLSPFYYSTPPDLEACNADAECEIIAITLRRLSRFDPNQSAQSGEEENTTSSSRQKARDILREDAESYTVSLLFKPSRPTRADRSHHSQGQVRNPRPSSQLQGEDLEELEEADDQFVSFLEHPFANLPPAIFPSTSRAWSCAAYLYLHLVVDCLPQQQRHAQEPVTMDKYLWRWLISSLRQDLVHTEEAMRIGAHSSELWLWKAMLGAYAMAKNPRETSDEVSSDDDDESDDENLLTTGMMASPGRSSGRSSQVSSSSDIADMQWFASKIRQWSSVVRTTSWDGAKKALSRIAWPEKFYDDDRLASLWDEAMESANLEDDL